MSEIILTSSGDRAASSTGMSSGHKPFDTVQEGHNPLVVWVLHLEHYTLFQWVVDAGSLDKCLTI